MNASPQSNWASVGTHQSVSARVTNRLGRFEAEKDVLGTHACAPARCPPSRMQPRVSEPLGVAPQGGPKGPSRQYQPSPRQLDRVPNDQPGDSGRDDEKQDRKQHAGLIPYRGAFRAESRRGAMRRQAWVGRHRHRARCAASDGAARRFHRGSSAALATGIAWVTKR